MRDTPEAYGEQLSLLEPYPETTHQSPAPSTNEPPLSTPSWEAPEDPWEGLGPQWRNAEDIAF